MCFPPSGSRYTPMTVPNVTVIDVKATVLNFTLAPVVSDTAGGFTMTTASPPSTNKSNHRATTAAAATAATSTQSAVLPPVSSPAVLPPKHQAIQPQEFRHHNNADMDLFLRKYSSEYPAITHLYSVGRSADNRDLYVMIISDNPAVHEHGMLCALIKLFYFFYSFPEIPQKPFCVVS